MSVLKLSNIDERSYDKDGSTIEQLKQVPAARKSK